MESEQVKRLFDDLVESCRINDLLADRIIALEEQNNVILGRMGDRLPWKAVRTMILLGRGGRPFKFRVGNELRKNSGGGGKPGRTGGGGGGGGDIEAELAAARGDMTSLQSERDRLKSGLDNINKELWKRDIEKNKELYNSLIQAETNAKEQIKSTSIKIEKIDAKIFEIKHREDRKIPESEKNYGETQLPKGWKYEPRKNIAAQNRRQWEMDHPL